MSLQRFCNSFLQVRVHLRAWEKHNLARGDQKQVASRIQSVNVNCQMSLLSCIAVWQMIKITFLTFFLISTVTKCFCNSEIQSYLFTPAILALSCHPPLSVTWKWKPQVGWRSGECLSAFVLKQGCASEHQRGLLTAAFRLKTWGACTIVLCKIDFPNSSRHQHCPWNAAVAALFSVQWLNSATKVLWRNTVCKLTSKLMMLIIDSKGQSPEYLLTHIGIVVRL